MKTIEINQDFRAWYSVKGVSLHNPVVEIVTGGDCLADTGVPENKVDLWRADVNITRSGHGTVIF